MPIVAPLSAPRCAPASTRGVPAPLLLHAVQRRADDRRGRGGRARCTSSSPARRRASSARRRWRRQIGARQVITFDMGGTTAKASMVEDGEVTPRRGVPGRRRHHDGSRLLTGAGYLLQVPAIDLAEVGAGGGSHRLDRRRRRAAGGAARARAPRPGRSATTTGGSEPTVTDANVMLGYINPPHLAGGALKLNAARARAVFAGEGRARRSGMPLEEAAYGAHLIAASNMIRAIRAVSSERGRDPREFALFAFGGNGPLFAGGHGRASSSIARIVVPPRAGPVLVLRAALRGRRAPLLAHVPQAAARRPTRRSSSDACDALERQAPGAARRRGLPGAAAADQALRGAALPGPDLRAGRSRCPTARSTPRRATGRGVRAGARAHLRPSRRERRAGGARAPAGDRAGLPGPRRARARASDRPEPRRRPRAASISAPGAAGSRRRCCAAPTSKAQGRARASSRSTTRPASSRRARAELDAGGNIVITL